ncbi:hypothetical protein TWF569_000662 [Orbilia oligospora]|nr:hypothetical protein TWF569_000662 [Orbilia oligospora]
MLRAVGRVDAMYVMYMCGGVPCFKALSDGNDLCQYTYITLLRLRLIDSFLPVSLEAHRHACLPASMMQTLVAGWRNLQALDERITGRTQPSTRLCSSSSPV